MGTLRTISPTAAGRVKKITDLVPRDIVLLKLSISFFAEYSVRVGNMATATATAKIPMGSCIILWPVRRAATIPAGRVEAKFD